MCERLQRERWAHRREQRWRGASKELLDVVALAKDYVLALGVDPHTEEAGDLTLVLYVPFIGQGGGELVVDGVLIVVRA